MNSVSDLRTTLGEHAGRVADGEAVVRVAAVRHRVAVVRRRRRAVGTGALALVIASVIGVVGVQRASSTTPPVVFGVQAPETMTALGYTYRSDGHAATFAGSGSVKISASGSPRLYSWTTDRPTQVRMVLPDGEIWTSGKSGFTDFVQIPAGQSGTLRISVPTGGVGLASYDLTDVPPAGYTKDGITFRQSVAGAPLLGAIISDVGQTDVTTSYLGTRGQVSISLTCTGLPHGDVVHVSFSGSERTEGDCSTEHTFDPGANGGSRSSERARGRVVVRAWVTQGFESKTPLAAGSTPDLQMLVGVYGPVGVTRVGGGEVESAVEHAGHTWTLASVHESPSGAPLDIDPVRQQMTAQMTWRAGSHRAEVVFQATGMTDAGGSVNGSGSAGIGDLWVPAGARVHAAFVHGHGRFGVAYYREVD